MTKKVPSIKIKTLLITLFDIQGIIHYEFVQPGHEKVGCKQLELFSNNSWLVHNANTPLDMALSRGVFAQETNNFGRPLAVPVSYTHLDVYKRQLVLWITGCSGSTHTCIYYLQVTSQCF